jgi:hypothetical protein
MRVVAAQARIAFVVVVDVDILAADTAFPRCRGITHDALADVDEIGFLTALVA